MEGKRSSGRQSWSDKGMVHRKRGLIRLPAVLFLFACLMLPCVYAYADSSDYGIEQIYINMPEVTVFYRGGDGQASATLDGEVLKVSESGSQILSETGIPVEYYILTDISGSIPDARFEDIRNSLTEFIRSKRENDKVILYSFGDTVTKLLDGNEEAEDAASVISGMVNNNQSTVLYDAIDEAAEAIVAAGDTSESRRLIIVISDGKDCADNTRSNTSAEDTLNSDGIALYTIAVENDEGDSEEMITQYQGQYASMSRNTGGLPWATSSPDVSIAEGLEYIRSSIMNSYYAVYYASSNRVSNKNEDFILDYGDNHILKRSVYVARSQPDTTVPAASVVDDRQENAIRIVFSKRVQNAEKTSSYSVTIDGKSIPVSQVIEDEEGISYRLVFHEALKGGSYQIAISSSVTDISNEKNPLEQNDLVYEKTEPETESETETEIETETAEEENTLVRFVKKWWIPLLVCSAVLLFLIIFLFIRHRRKQKAEQPGTPPEVLPDGHLVNDHFVANGDYGRKNHVVINQIPTKDVVIWVSNGKDTPKRLEQHISSSLIVGRSTSCDLYCDDPMMSKQHFAIEIEDDQLMISDLDSRNGTSVNGVAVHVRQKLESHDEIAAGNLKFTIEW